jgi:hypothetical protein
LDDVPDLTVINDAIDEAMILIDGNGPDNRFESVETNSAR